MNITVENGRYGKLPRQVFRTMGNSHEHQHAIVFVHGGGHVRGSMDNKNLAGAEEYFAKLGYRTFSINYEYATPTHKKYPYGLWEVELAIGHFRSHFNILSLTIVGTSAGASVVAQSSNHYANQTAKNPPTYRWKPADAIVLFYGVLNYQELERDLLVNEKTSVVDMIHQYLGTDNPKVLERASPHNNVSGIAKLKIPTLIFHGDSDIVVKDLQSQDYHERLSSANPLRTYFIIREGRPHGYPVVDEGSVIDTFIKDIALKPF